MESALRIAHSLTWGNFGDAVCADYRYAITVDELLSSRILFELQSLNNSEKKFFCEYLLSMIYFYKKANHETTDKFHSIVVVDEAHNVFLKDKPRFIKESVTDLIYREMREYGIGLVCFDQHVSKLSDVVAGNSATIIAFQQILPADVESISHIMQIKEHKNYFNMLPIGSAIVKLAERFFTPFLIEVPLIPDAQKTVSDAHIQQTMEKRVKESIRMKVHTENMDTDTLAENLTRLAELRGDAVESDFSFVYVDPKKAVRKPKDKQVRDHHNTYNHLQLDIVQELKELLGAGFPQDKIRQYFEKRGYNPTDINRAIKNVKAKIANESIDPKAINVKQLRVFVKKNKVVELILKKLVKTPMPTTQLYKVMKLNARKGNEIKKLLLKFALVKEVEDRSNKGWRKFLEVTEIGKQCLG
jgi:DNA-binding transcriptional MerR regulator